jgi:murein DD-endopeptidase MepM/ murein hydrolase activator NlpD
MTRRVLIGVAVVGVLAMAAAVVVPMVMLSVMFGEADISGGRISDCSIDDTGVTVSDLNEDQLANARTVITVGETLKVPSRGLVVAIAAAMQESGLRNLHYGDRDSQGLFQQRPSAGWGTNGEVTDPSYAARAFFGGPKSPTDNSGLLDIRRWKSMAVWEAAQRVQRSAFPLAYARHEALATRVVNRLTGTSSECEPLQPGPWLLPISASYMLTSGFGMRTSPTRDTSDFHTGQDFAVPAGTRTRAVSNGEVVFTGWAGGYGNLVKLRHANEVESWYAHLSRITVSVGDRVERGTVIGLAGSTGNSTGPHLHLETRVHGNPTDPIPWLRAKGLDP